MRVQLQCKACQTQWQVTHEPRHLTHIVCPQCQNVCEGRASEDLASALEDALCQLWRISQTTHVDIHLSTHTIPGAFTPESKPDG